MGMQDIITTKLVAAFAPESLHVEDESHLHAGHAGHRPGGETHFRVYIVSSAFRGKGRLESHRMINTGASKRTQKPRPCASHSCGGALRNQVSYCSIGTERRCLAVVLSSRPASIAAKWKISAGRCQQEPQSRSDYYRAVRSRRARFIGEDLWKSPHKRR